MLEFDKIIKSMINESLSNKADELTEKIFGKIESNEDVDKYDLEVGTDYGFDDNDEDYTFIRRGKHSSHGPFHFKRNKIGGETAFGEKKIANMKKRIKENVNLKQGPKDLELAAQAMEQEMEEGNAFTGALARAKKEGKKSFNVDGKEFEVTEDLGGMGLGMGHDDFEDINLSDDENPRVKAIKKKYNRPYPKHDEVDQEVDFTSGNEEPVNYRIKMGDGDFLDLAESELVDMIEELVNEEKVKDNLKKTGKPAGLVQYDRVSKKDKSENSRANKESFKKMSDYVKAGSKGKFESNPVMFPLGNGELGEMSKKAYVPSEYVDEYVDAFSHPGQLNIRYDEIKPNDKFIEMNLKGNSKTGNAQVDKDGNQLGNVVPTKTGEKFYKNYKENLFGAEQSEASYKRQSQPVDIAGETTQKGGLKRKGKTSSVDKANKILTKLGESTESESTKLLNEEMETMKKLIGYGYKK
jgi:hypothetical protein